MQSDPIQCQDGKHMGKLTAYNIGIANGGAGHWSNQQR